jgi:acetylcholinesterase
LSALKANFTPSLIPIFGADLLDVDAQRLLELYPNDPSVGSPFGTGNETFGFNPAYKQEAALVTDLSFVSQRRLLSKSATLHGVKNYGYLFTDPQPADPPYLGGLSDHISASLVFSYS